MMDSNFLEACNIKFENITRSRGRLVVIKMPDQYTSTNEIDIEKLSFLYWLVHQQTIDVIVIHFEKSYNSNTIFFTLSRCENVVTITSYHTRGYHHVNVEVQSIVIQTDPIGTLESRLKWRETINDTVLEGLLKSLLDLCKWNISRTLIPTSMVDGIFLDTSTSTTRTSWYSDYRRTTNLSQTHQSANYWEWVTCPSSIDRTITSITCTYSQLQLSLINNGMILPSPKSVIMEDGLFTIVYLNPRTASIRVRDGRIEITVTLDCRVFTKTAWNELCSPFLSLSCNNHSNRKLAVSRSSTDQLSNRAARRQLKRLRQIIGSDIDIEEALVELSLDLVSYCSKIVP